MTNEGAVLFNKVSPTIRYDQLYRTYFFLNSYINWFDFKNI